MILLLFTKKPRRPPGLDHPARTGRQPYLPDRPGRPRQRLPGSIRARPVTLTDSCGRGTRERLWRANSSRPADATPVDENHTPAVRLGHNRQRSLAALRFPPRAEPALL